MVIDLNAFAGLISAAAAIVALFATWLQWRGAQYRRESVHAWGSEVIEEIQLLELACTLDQKALSNQRRDEILEAGILRTSILVEKGRMFFKNKVIDEYGADKPVAYRGYRPKILDEIVVVHRVALEWRSPNRSYSDADAIKLLCQAKREFVSLLQKEVGRQKSASTDTSRHGDGAHLLQRLRGKHRAH